MTLTINIALSDLKFELAALLAINQDMLGSLKIGQLMIMDQMLKCFISTLHKGRISELDVQVGSIDSFTVSGFETPETSSAADSLSRVVLESYEDLILSSIRPLFGYTFLTMA